MRKQSIHFLGKVVRQVKDESIPYSYRKMIFLFLVRPNEFFNQTCSNIGIDPDVWRTKYQKLFGDMFKVF